MNKIEKKLCSLEAHILVGKGLRQNKVRYTYKIYKILGPFWRLSFCGYPFWQTGAQTSAENDFKIFKKDLAISKLFFAF